VKKIIIIIINIIILYCLINEKRIYGEIIKEVKITKYLIDKGRKYKGRYLIDKDINTCWAYRVKGDIKREDIKIIFILKKDIEITNISIVNGYAKSIELYKKNARIKDIELIFKRDEKEVCRKIYQLKDIYDIQNINIKLKKKVNRIDLKILDIYKGSKWNDICISEIFVNNKYNATTMYYVERIGNGISREKRDKLALKKFLSYINYKCHKCREYDSGQIEDLYKKNVKLCSQILLEISINPIRGVSINEYFGDSFRGLVWDGNTSEDVYKGISKSLKYIGYDNSKVADRIIEILNMYFEGLEDYYKYGGVKEGLGISNFNQKKHIETLNRMEEIVEAYKIYSTNQKIKQSMNKILERINKERDKWQRKR